MGDSENTSQPSKKRAAGVQLSRDNPGLDDNEDTSEQESGTFRRASDEILATRRIVKVRRQEPPSAPAPAPAVASNPFAAIRLVPASTAEVEVHGGKEKENEKTDENKSENTVDEQTDESNTEQGKNDTNEDTAEKSENKIDAIKSETDAQKDEEKIESIAEEVKADVNAGESKKTIDDGKSNPNSQEDETNNDKTIETVKSASDDGVDKSTETGKDEVNHKEKENEAATGGDNVEAAAAPFSSFRQLSSGQNAFSGFTGSGFFSTSFSFGALNGVKVDPTLGSGTTSLFGPKNGPDFGFSVSNGKSSTNLVTKSEGSKLVEVPVETGEENEKSVFSANSILFEFTDGAWKERGKGEVKVNVPTTGTGKARLIMRTKGNYRLILNASLFPDMNLTNMDKKGISFACLNSAAEGKEGLSTIALKFRDASAVEEFRAVIDKHKSRAPAALKTPENSPGADEP